MKYNIFFSWQSDVNTKNTRDMVNSAIQNLKNYNIDVEYSYYPAENMAGAPNIAEIVKNKIKDTDVFIADLTTVGKVNGKEKYCQNSNTCFELGLARVYCQ